MIQPYYLMFLMQAAHSQNSSSSTPFTNPSYSCRRYKHFLSCKLSGQCLQKEYNLKFSPSPSLLIMCNRSHVKMSILMQGKISNIYRKKNFKTEIQYRKFTFIFQFFTTIGLFLLFLQ